MGGAAARPPRPTRDGALAMNAATRAASISAVAALVLAAVWFFWPAALGGGTTYVTTHGISMEPGSHTGDLAILRADRLVLRRRRRRLPERGLDTIVMHRIVVRDGDRFVLQGDNNDWLDADQPDPGPDPRQPLPPRPPGRQGARRADFAGHPRSSVARRPRSPLLGAARASAPAQRRAGRRDARPSPVALDADPRARPAGRAGLRRRGASRGRRRRRPPAAPVDADRFAHPQVTQQGQFSYSGEAEAGTTYPTASSPPATPSTRG